MLTVVFVACEQGDRLPAAIAHARRYAGEVVCVVQASRDHTLSVARSLADITIEHPGYGFCEMSRPAGIAAARGPWVLLLDIDERLTDEAISAVPRVLQSTDRFVRMRRVSMIDHQVIEDRPCCRLFADARVPIQIHAEPSPARESDGVGNLGPGVAMVCCKTSAQKRAELQRYRQAVESGVVLANPIVTRAAIAPDGMPAGWFDHREGAAYSEVIAMSPPGDVVEVGTWYGRSAAFVGPVCRAQRRRLRCVDNWEGGPELADQARLTDPFQVFLYNAHRMGIDDVVHPIRCSSVPAADRFVPRSLAAVMIDASHTYEAVRADIAAWLPKVKPGGAILGHDYTSGWPGVVRAVDETGLKFGVESTLWFARV